MIGEKLTTEQRSAIIALTAEGASISKTAKAISCSRQSVQHYRKIPEVRAAIEEAAKRLAAASAKTIVDIDLAILEASKARIRRKGLRDLSTTDLLKLSDKKADRIGTSIGLYASPAKGTSTVIQSLTLNSGSSPLHPAVAEALSEAAARLLGNMARAGGGGEEMLPLPLPGGAVSDKDAFDEQ